MFTERERNTKRALATIWVCMYTWIPGVWGHVSMNVWRPVETSGGLLHHTPVYCLRQGHSPACLRQGLSLHVEIAIGWTDWPASGTVQPPSLCCGYSCLTLCPALNPRAREQCFMLVKQARLPSLLLTSLPTGLLSSAQATGFYLKIRPDSPLYML